MGPLTRQSCIGCLLTLAWLLIAWLNAAEIDVQKLPPAAKEQVDFKRDIYPLLAAHCFKCHQGADAKAGIRLDLRAELLGQSTGEPLVVAGKSDKSRLIHLVSGLAEKVMPPKGERLTAQQVGLLRAWIDQGPRWDDSLLPPVDAASTHWAFQPISAPAVPPVKNSGWVKTPVDAFIAARHEVKGLAPAPEADRRVLIRRLALDLTGLPPSPEDVEAFITDTSSHAYDKLVERLLASPHYGQRWGRHWLDLARWADSEGYESDHIRPAAWRYRDYVVASFNSDKPYDRFLREQIAGDELLPYSEENLIATGFLASARLSSNEEDKARQRNDVLVDIVNATSSTVLGLTMGCAQCHNHKFDPFTQRDYYRFQGFFVKGAPNNLALKDPGLWAAYEAAKPAEYDPAKKLQQALLDGAKTRLIADARKKLPPEHLKALDTPSEKRTPDQEKLAREADLKFQFTQGQLERAISEEDRKLYDELKKKIEALEKRMPDKPHTFGFYSPATSPTKVDVLPMKGFYPPPYNPSELARARPYLLLAGDVHQRSAELDPGWPVIFGAVPRDKIDKQPRQALVDWLVDPRNPLTARVWANRIWQYHFGRGLVTTPSDFGLKGARPSHPELLDWLASELIRNGWSTKHVHRLIVQSSTYRQSSQHHAENAERDPDNLLWWRWSPRRLESEAIRDAMLAVSGELDRKMEGPSVPADDSVRHGIYLLQRRNTRSAFQSLFDGPLATESCARRHVTTVSLQPLFLLNNEFVLKRAKAFAKRIQDKAGTDPARQVTLAFELALGRPPDEKEQELARRFFESHNGAPASGEPPLALVHFCQALLNVNEFVYVE